MGTAISSESGIIFQDGLVNWLFLKQIKKFIVEITCWNLF